MLLKFIASSNNEDKDREALDKASKELEKEIIKIKKPKEVSTTERLRAEFVEHRKKNSTGPNLGRRKSDKPK